MQKLGGKEEEPGYLGAAYNAAGGALRTVYDAAGNVVCEPISKCLKSWTDRVALRLEQLPIQLVPTYTDQATRANQRKKLKPKRPKAMLSYRKAKLDQKGKPQRKTKKL